MTLQLFHRTLLVLTLPFFLTIMPLAAQDTLGSLVPDAPVVLMDGSTMAAQDLQVGTKIWTWMPSEKPTEGKVTSIRRVHSDTYIELLAGNYQIEATGSHRIAGTGNKLVRLDTVKTGDKILTWGPKGPEETAVKSLRTLPVTLITYDLTIEGHRMFQVGGILVGD